MEFWTGAVWLPLLGAVLHPVLGWAIQRATRGGTGMVLLAGTGSILTAVVVLGYLRPTGSWQPSGLDWVAIANGALFFLGQWFSIQSVRHGNLAVHSSVLGVKILIVAALSLGFGLEAGGRFLLLSVLVAVVAVFLVAGASWSGLRKHRDTVALTLTACLFFGVNDYLTGNFGARLGTARWMAFMFGTSAALSTVLLFSRRDQLVAVARSGSARWFLLLAGLILGVQSLLVNIAFSEYQQPTLSNVVYSTRGVMAVAWLFFLGGSEGREHWPRRVAGSVLMILALWLAMRG